MVMKNIDELIHKPNLGFTSNLKNEFNHFMEFD